MLGVQGRSGEALSQYCRAGIYVMQDYWFKESAVFVPGHTTRQIL